MKFSRLTLARKLILTMMATSSTALLVACVSFLSYDAIVLRHSIADHLHGLANITGENVAAALTYNDPKSARLVLEALRAEPHIVAAQIYDGNGRSFAAYHQASSASTIQLPEVAPAPANRLDGDRISECDAIILDGEPIGYIYLVSDLQEIHARMRRFVMFTLILIAASSAAGFLVAISLRRLISKP